MSELNRRMRLLDGRDLVEHELEARFILSPPEHRIAVLEQIDKEINSERPGSRTYASKLHTKMNLNRVHQGMLKAGK